MELIRAVVAHLEGAGLGGGGPSVAIDLRMTTWGTFEIDGAFVVAPPPLPISLRVERAGLNDVEIDVPTPPPCRLTRTDGGARRGNLGGGGPRRQSGAGGAQ
jgi:hypothetical protein